MASSEPSIGFVEDAGVSRHQTLVKVIEFNDRDPRRIQEAIEAGLRRCSPKSTFCFWKHFGKVCLTGARPAPTAARGSSATRRTSPSAFPQSHGYRELDGRLARRTPASGCRHRHTAQLGCPLNLAPVGAVLRQGRSLTVGRRGGMRDCGRGKWWKKVAPIEHGERRAQHDHADGQGQDPPRHVIRLVSLDADLRAQD